LAFEGLALQPAESPERMKE